MHEQMNLIRGRLRVLSIVLACAMTLSAAAQQTDTKSGGQQNVPPAEVKAIGWTEVPTVDKSDPTLQMGIVYGPDGEPLPGAKIYAASAIKLFELRSPDEVTTEDLGPVRAQTDDRGRFEFHTPDLTWTPAPGQRKRWEALLVATHDGLAPGWIKTWGEDRGFRSHWHPHSSKKVAIHLGRPATFRGRFIGPDDEPVADAKVKLTGLMIPRDRDMEKHIERLLNPRPFSTVDYQETVYRPWLLPGLNTETQTDADGRFDLAGLVEDFIVRIEVSHPKMQTTKLYGAVREMESLYRQPSEFQDHPDPMLLGSDFEHPLREGVILRGQVRRGFGIVGRTPVVGATVALANHNAPDGMTGQRFKTDAEGRFKITGLGPDYNDPGYVIAVVGSIDAPIEGRRFTLHPHHEARLSVPAAAAYRLKLSDSGGEPIDRDVYSITVQRFPDQTGQGVAYRFDKAVRLAPGQYEGIVPKGPGAVIVKRGSRRDRPVAVDPKAFFEPGRTDWTAAEARYAYGDQWQISGPGIITTTSLVANKNVRHSQLDMAAVVFTNGGTNNEPLELTATVFQDDPPNVTLVDESGKAVDGVRVTRQLKKYNAKKMPATFPLYGLHPERAEYIQFYHEQRALIGFLRATHSHKPLQVTMRPAATLTGSFVTKNGETSYDFGALVKGAVPPQTHLGNFVRNTDRAPKGRFALVVPPNETYSGKLTRKTRNSWYPRPIIGQAFAPVTPEPGEVVDLGEIVVP